MRMINTNSKLFKANPFIALGFILIVSRIINIFINFEGITSAIIAFWVFILISIYFVIYSIRFLVSLSKDKENVAKPYKNIIAILSLIFWVIITFSLVLAFFIVIFLSGGPLF